MHNNTNKPAEYALTAIATILVLAMWLAPLVFFAWLVSLFIR